MTGGCGFIGAFLVRSLLEAGAKVRIADNLERGSVESLGAAGDRVELQKVDLREPDAARRACDGMDVVFHLASKVGGIGYYLKYPWDVLHSNLTMDGNVLSSLIEASVPYYFYASSAHIYPIELQLQIEAPLIREDQAYPANPSLSYGWAKLIGEQGITAALAEGHQFLRRIARIVGAYGPGQDYKLETGSVIPVFCHRAVRYPELKPFRVLGTGKETRTYCYVDDVVRAILVSVEKLADSPQVGPFNLGTCDSCRSPRLRKRSLAFRIRTSKSTTTHCTRRRSGPSPGYHTSGEAAGRVEAARFAARRTKNLLPGREIAS